MILYPSPKECFLVLLDQFSNPSQVCVLESVISPKFYGRQKDNHVPLILRHMDVSGLMIVWINRDIVAMFLTVKQFNQSDNLIATIPYTQRLRITLNASLILERFACTVDS